MPTPANVAPCNACCSGASAIDFATASRRSSPVVATGNWGGPAAHVSVANGRDVAGAMADQPGVRAQRWSSPVRSATTKPDGAPLVSCS